MEVISFKIYTNGLKDYIMRIIYQSHKIIWTGRYNQSTVKENDH